MCYSYKPVIGPDGRTYKVPNKEWHQLNNEGKLKKVWTEDGIQYHYAKDTVAVTVGKDYRLLPMRWDLIPRGFMAGHPEFSLAEVIKKKNSRAINPETGKRWGFDSYNARSESIATTWSFKLPWKEGKRCVVAASSFRERPNMDEAPPEFKGKEYMVHLGKPYFLAGIWDTWTRGEESLDSMSIVTLDSLGNDRLRSIWHERCPVILDEGQAEEWLDPKTTPARAKELCRLVPAEQMEIELVAPRAPKSG